MPAPRGKFIWYDVMTSDTKAATAFYSDVIGWQAQEHAMPDNGSYTVFSKGERMVAGLMALPESCARKACAHAGPDISRVTTSTPMPHAWSRRAVLSGARPRMFRMWAALPSAAPPLARRRGTTKTSVNRQESKVVQHRKKKDDLIESIPDTTNVSSASRRARGRSFIFGHTAITHPEIARDIEVRVDADFERIFGSE